MKLAFNMGLRLTEAIYEISNGNIGPYYSSFITMSKLWHQHPDYYAFYLNWSYRRLL